MAEVADGEIAVGFCKEPMTIERDLGAAPVVVGKADLVPPLRPVIPARISLCGERGCPLVVLVLDQTQGAEAIAQANRFERLREAYGPLARLVSAEQLPPGRPDAHASVGAEGTPLAAVADGGTLWH